MESKQTTMGLLPSRPAHSLLLAALVVSAHGSSVSGHGSSVSGHGSGADVLPAAGIKVHGCMHMNASFPFCDTTLSFTGKD